MVNEKPLQVLVSERKTLNNFIQANPQHKHIDTYKGQLVALDKKIADRRGETNSHTQVGLLDEEMDTLDETTITTNEKPAEEPTKRQKKRAITSEDYLKALEKLGYSFKMNVCNDVVEVNGEPITDPIRAKIRVQMRDKGFKRHIQAIEDAYLAHAHHNSYHPIREWLKSLRWDGVKRLDELGTYFEDTHSIFSLWLKKWMLGAIAKVVMQSQNVMLVLDGPQGCGKSYFVSWLTSPFKDYALEGPINPDDKDCWLRLITNFVWEVAELGATTRRADREALKNFISQAKVTVRKPYGRGDIDKPAMASLIGTINNEAGFLTDPTGNRRFLVCELTRIDWSYTTQLDASQLWAEAYHLFLNGEKWELSFTEKSTQQAINAAYRVESPVGEFFLRYYQVDPNVTELTSTLEIIRHLENMGLKGSQRSNQMELAGFLKEQGVEKVSDGQKRGYRGIKQKNLTEL